MLGYAGKILFINLSDKSYYCERTEKYSGYIGGRGINQYILLRDSTKEIDSLDEKSQIIIGAGLFVGTGAPCCSRTSVDFRNVMTGGIGSANVGGYFGAKMKFAGFDHIVIKGKSKEPCYIYLENDEVFFKDASKIWGRDTWETEEIIQRKENNNRISTISIGIGGENLVKYASLIGDKGRAAGYGGCGAIFGSKNLKAIAVAGDKEISLYDKDEFDSYAHGMKNTFENNATVSSLRKGGTLISYLKDKNDRAHGFKNMSDDFINDYILFNVNRELLDEKYLLYRKGCHSCVAKCSGIYEYRGEKFEGIQANMWRAFISNLGINDEEGLLRANLKVNRYGLDSDQTSAVIAWLFESYEKGLLEDINTNDLEIKWGNHETVLKLIDMIATRSGIGNILAEGVSFAIDKLGRKAKKTSMLTKNTSIMEAGMRVYKGWSLGIITSAKGGGHLRGASALEMKNINKQNSMKHLGFIKNNDPTSYEGKAELAVWTEYYKGLVDSLGICVSVSSWCDIELYTMEQITSLYLLLTGDLEITKEKLFRASERIANIEKIYNQFIGGFYKADDFPPDKLVVDEVSDGKYKGERIDIDKWESMLNQYYEIHGWDTKNGRVSFTKIKQIGLEEFKSYFDRSEDITE